MRIGINTLIWSVAFDPAIIPWQALREAGVDGIEAPCFAPAEFPLAAFRQAIADHGFQATMCSVNPARGNPVSDDAVERRAALEHWRRAIETAREGGAEILAGPTYAPVGYLPGRRRTADEWRRAVEFHQQLGESLEEAEVELAIEPINRFETYFLNTAADARRLADEINHPRIGILLDTFHSNIEDKSLEAAYRACGPRLKHVHTCENDRGTPGSGHVPWSTTLRAIREMGYDGWLTIESFNANQPEIAAATAIWRDLAASGEELAVRGARFLRSTWEAL